MAAKPPRRAEDLLARRGGAVEFLQLPALAVRAAAGLRRRLYDGRWLPVARLDVPVVCVGNLTVGGTGKTPFVAWLAKALGERGWRIGLLSRGFRARRGSNDEARLLHDTLPDVPHVQDPDRVAGGTELVRRGVDLIVMDDGFQHRRVGRDLDLVLVDATRPWGLPAPPRGGAPVGAHLPRGFLRESPRALRRAHAIVLTRTDQVERAVLDALRAELEGHAPGVPLIEARHRPRAVREPGGALAHPECLRGRRVDLVSGIGNPEAFEATVRSLGADVGEHRRFADHHEFVAADVGGVGDAAGVGADERWLVVTAKDAVKLAPLGVRVHVLLVELAIERGRPVLDALLDALVPGPAARARRALHEGQHG